MNKHKSRKFQITHILQFIHLNQIITSRFYFYGELRIFHHPRRRQAVKLSETHTPTLPTAIESAVNLKCATLCRERENLYLRVVMLVQSTSSLDPCMHIWKCLSFIYGARMKSTLHRNQHMQYGQTLKLNTHAACDLYFGEANIIRYFRVFVLNFPAFSCTHKIFIGHVWCDTCAGIERSNR